MNFTREPIIETVITPREGCKLVIRNSKGGGREDYFVDAIEVVSFGHSLFFRSLERPQAFLVPVSDYEIFELKETRMALKNAGPERSIKIGGGRETSVRTQTREIPEEPMPSEAIASEPTLQTTPVMQERMDKKRDRRRSRRRRGGGPAMEPRHESAPVSEEKVEIQPIAEGTEKSVEETPAPSFISKLFPPPPTLIKETLGRYKISEEGPITEEKTKLPEDLEPPLSNPQQTKGDEETRFDE